MGTLWTAALLHLTEGPDTPRWTTRCHGGRCVAIGLPWAESTKNLGKCTTVQDQTFINKSSYPRIAETTMLRECP
jgi:hypothetical protein